MMLIILIQFIYNNINALQKNRPKPYTAQTKRF